MLLQRPSSMVVYTLQSKTSPGRYYTGITDDLKARLATHNRGEVKHTSKFRPWRIDTAHYFREEVKARAFERYLKSGSGRAFAKRHF